MNDLVNYCLLLFSSFISFFSTSFVTIFYIHSGFYQSCLGKLDILFSSISAFKNLIIFIFVIYFGSLNEINEKSPQCVAVTVINVFFTILGLLIILVKIFSIFLSVSLGIHDLGKFKKPCICLIVIIPILSTIVIACTDSIRVVGDWCWIGPEFIAIRFSLFYGPLIVIKSVCFVLYANILYHYYKKYKSSCGGIQEYDQFKKQFKFAYPLIALLVCYIFLHVNAIRDIVGTGNNWMATIYLFHGAANSFIILYTNSSLDKQYYQSFYTSFKSFIIRIIQFKFTRETTVNSIGIINVQQPALLLLRNQN